MKRFVEGTDRGQSALFPAMLDDYVGEDNPVRAIDVFVDGLDLFELGISRGRSRIHPLGSTTQLQACVRHITLLAPKVVVASPVFERSPR